MKMSKLSNQTNSQDPQAVNSRVFVGNLNTFQCSKTDVERMFQKYGRLVGISMHKGYAFVQFTNPFDARNACHGEDGRTILSQVLDVNMVAEPKPHQTGRKRQNVTKTGNDWDYYYDSYYASTLFNPTPARPSKRQRLMAPQNRLTLAANKLNSTLASITLPQAAAQLQQQQQSLQLHQLQQQQQQQLQQQQLQSVIYPASPTASLSASPIGVCNGANGDVNGTAPTTAHPATGLFKTYSNPDTLICGNCRELFTDLAELLDHKRAYCKLRFTCKCQESASSPSSSVNKYPSTKLLCVVCKESFANPWDLMVHAQAAHMINIYEIGDSDDEKTDTEASDEVSSINNDGIADTTDKVNGNGVATGNAGGAQQEENKLDGTNTEFSAFNNSPHDGMTIKMNGNGCDVMSHSDTSNEELSTPPHTCIMSIEATTEVSSAIGLASSNGLTISIGNGGIATK